jgi:CHAD domain-containing protein
MPVPAALARLVTAEWKRLRDAWGDLESGDAELVRRARIATRRLREAFADQVPATHAFDAAAGRYLRHARQARRALRQVTRSLGAVRETDVNLELFDALSGRLTPGGDGPSVLRRQLEQTARRRRTSLRRWLHGFDRDALDGRIGGALEDLAGLSASILSAILLTRLLRRAREVQLAARHCGVLYDPERLHILRIAIKKLRYGLESTEAAGLTALPSVLAALVSIQKQLGGMHDRQVLQEAIRVAAGRRPAVAATAELAADALERECRWMHAQVVTDMGVLQAGILEVRQAVMSAAAGPRRPARGGQAADRSTARKAPPVSRAAGGRLRRAGPASSSRRARG